MKSTAMSKPTTCALIGACLMCAFAPAHAQTTLTPVPLHLDVPVSDLGNDNSLASSNTSRKLAVAADGTIYALFRSATNGIRVTRSTDRGQSFGASVQVAAVNAEAEIAIASDGDLHVAWIVGGNIQHAVSRDGAVSFSTPVVVGAGANSAHMALDGDRVYIIPRNGSVVYRSSDDGATFAQTSTGSAFAFADIFVDPLTRDVLLVADNPSVFFFVSTDFAQTFTGPTATGKSVFFSVGALAVTGTDRYLFLAGSGTNLERIEADTPAFFTATVAATSGSTTRSLSADAFGNVVSGYLEAGTNDLKFEHSNDLAATLAPATTVVTGAARANAAINTINGDILFLYEKSNQIFLSAYSRGLISYDINVAPSALNFGGVPLDEQSSMPITLTNVSTGAIAVTSLTASTGFSLTHDCGSSIAAGDDCTVTVTFAPTALGAASGALSMTLGGATRQLPLSGTGLPARQPTATQLDASATSVDVGDNVTLDAVVTGNAATGTVDFTEGGAAVAGCSAVALIGTTASCTVSGLTAGVKNYSAAYSGDALNLPSNSAAVTVTVGLFTVTPTAATGGSINPGAPQTVVFGDTAAFAVVPDSAHRVDTVSGCGGTLSGSTYTTGPITADCSVSATFALNNEEVEVVAESEGGGGAMSWPMLLIGILAVFARRGMVPLLASLLVLCRAQAEESRWFVGGALGQAKGEQGSADVAANLAQQGFTADAVNVRDLDRTAYRLFAGCRVTPNWVLEVGYTDLGDVPTSASANVPVGQAEAYARALLGALPVSASGYEASFGYRYPFGDAFAVAARTGVWRWENDQRATFGNQRLSASPDGTDALFGVAFEWRFAKHWAVGAEANRYRTDDEDLDVLAANVRFIW